MNRLPAQGGRGFFLSPTNPSFKQKSAGAPSPLYQQESSGKTFLAGLLVQPRHHEDPALDTLGGPLPAVVLHAFKLSVVPL